MHENLKRDRAMYVAAKGEKGKSNETAMLNDLGMYYVV